MATSQSVPQHRHPAGRSAADDAASEKRLRRLAWLLDHSIPLPGGYRIGLDGLVGLVPGIGDAAGALVASYVVVETGHLSAPKALLLRMAFNVFLDAAIGAIPLAGDLFDFVYKANMRNLRLLEGHARDPVGQRKSNRAVAAAIIIAVLAVVGLIVWAAAALLGALFDAAAG